MTHRVAPLAVVLVIAAWNAALVAAPLAHAPGVSALTYVAGSLVCHQQPERSFQIAGAQMPVCARCGGLYGGALIGALAWLAAAGRWRTPGAAAHPWVRFPRLRRLLIGAALPTVISVALGAAGIWDGTNIVRALIAVPLGAVIAVVLAAAAAGDLR